MCVYIYIHLLQTVGSYKKELDATTATTSCSTTPSDYDHFDYFPSRSSTESTTTEDTGTADATDAPVDNDATSNDEDKDDDGTTNKTSVDDDLVPGVNGAAKPSEEDIREIEMNTVGVSNDDGECTNLVSTNKVDLEHSYYVDGSTDIENLFDGDHVSYFSVHRESTTLTFELAAETSIEGVSIGFFIKNGEDRIQTFDISVREADTTEWTTVISGGESDGTTSSQHFTFVSPHQALYVQFKSRGNTFNK